MIKLQETPVNKEGNFFDYRILAKARNEHLGKYALPTDLKLKEINNIFIKNNYIPVDITGKIWSEIPTISGVPILNPKVIVFGGFEYHCWGVKDNKILSCFKELTNKNLINKILSYGNESSAVEDIKRIESYCKINNISFEFNDLPDDTQFKIRKLKKLDYYHNKKAYDKNTAKEKIDEHLGVCSNAANEVYNLFKKRAEHCAVSLEKKIRDFKLVVQLLSLEEVANAPYIAEELSKRNIPFVSYIPNDVPH